MIAEDIETGLTAAGPLREAKHTIMGIAQGPL
jgi:hypothetical protein